MFYASLSSTSQHQLPSHPVHIPSTVSLLSPSHLFKLHAALKYPISIKQILLFQELSLYSYHPVVSILYKYHGAHALLSCSISIPVSNTVLFANKLATRVLSLLSIFKLVPRPFIYVFISPMHPSMYVQLKQLQWCLSPLLQLCTCRLYVKVLTVDHPQPTNMSLSLCQMPNPFNKCLTVP